MNRLAFMNARLVDPASKLDTAGGLYVEDGSICDLGPRLFHDGTPAGAMIIDCKGRTLAPGLIDMRVFTGEPGSEHRETLESASLAAAAGGVTTIVVMPNTDPVLDSAPLLRSLQDAAARQARVAVGFMPAITRGSEGRQLTEMAELRAEGAVGFSDDGRPVESAGMVRKALQYQRLCGGVLALHEEDPTLSHGGSVNEGVISAALAGYENARVHFQHVSCADSVEAIADARSRGWRVSAEVTPHHLLLTEQDVRGMDTRMKMNPPLATDNARQALIDGLRAGTIDCVATDHAPHARDEKEVPFEQAPMGTTGLETAFAALYTGLVRTGVLPLALLVERMTAGARLFELPSATIAPGEPANMVLVDLDAAWIAGERGWESRSENCCFAGRPLHGRVLLTVAAGAVAYRDRTAVMTAR